MKLLLILLIESQRMASSRARLDIAQTQRFPKLLKPTRQPLAETLGLVVGVVVVRRGGHGGSYGHLASVMPSPFHRPRPS